MSKLISCTQWYATFASTTAITSGSTNVGGNSTSRLWIRLVSFMLLFLQLTWCWKYQTYSTSWLNRKRMGAYCLRFIWISSRNTHHAEWHSTKQQCLRMYSKPTKHMSALDANYQITDLYSSKCCGIQNFSGKTGICTNAISNTSKYVVNNPSADWLHIAT